VTPLEITVTVLLIVGATVSAWFQLRTARDADRAAATVATATPAELARIKATLNERFVRAISHDLKEPARAVSGFTEILLSHADTMGEAQRRDFLQRANEASRHLLAMIQALQSYVLDTSGNGPCVTPRELIEGALTAMQGRLAEAMVETHLVEVTDDVEVPANIARVVQNLLDNSVKYAGDEALEIRIEARLQEGELFVEVTDNGMGFRPEEASYIFEPFHRLDPHRERPGIGMGLAICRDAVSKYGGRIWATSNGLGEGATFSFRVPTHPRPGSPDETDRTSRRPRRPAVARSRPPAPGGDRGRSAPLGARPPSAPDHPRPQPARP
jgi:signal transduction histidine kinase